MIGPACCGLGKFGGGCVSGCVIDGNDLKAETVKRDDNFFEHGQDVSGFVEEGDQNAKIGLGLGQVAAGLLILYPTRLAGSPLWMSSRPKARNGGGYGHVSGLVRVKTRC